jgi:hypothetical protein
MRNLVIIASASLILFGCITDPETALKIATDLQKAVDKGIISPDQKKLLLDSFTAGNTSGIWPAIQSFLVDVVVPVGLSLLSVGAWRGGIKNRKGVAPKG